MPYPLFNETNGYNMTKIEDLLKYPNDLTGNKWGNSILVMVFVITMGVTLRFNLKTRIIASTFITMLTSIFLTSLGITSEQTILVTTLLFVFSLFIE